jgi:hypothetical protein
LRQPKTMRPDTNGRTGNFSEVNQVEFKIRFFKCGVVIFFEQAGHRLSVMERETGFEPSTSYLEATKLKNWEALAVPTASSL